MRIRNLSFYIILSLLLVYNFYSLFTYNNVPPLFASVYLQYVVWYPVRLISTKGCFFNLLSDNYSNNIEFKFKHFK